MLFLLSSPSGAGKSSVISALISRGVKLRLVVSFTTRLPRSGEIDAVDYHFISVETFKEMVEKGEFFEWEEICGNFYGTRAVDLSCSSDECVIHDVDWKGAENIMRSFSAISIFIMPPSYDELESRLINRNSDSSASITKRMKRAIEEVKQYKKYRYVIVNHDLENTVDKMYEVIASGSKEIAFDDCGDSEESLEIISQSFVSRS